MDMQIQESHGTPTRTNPKNHTGTYYLKRWEGGQWDTIFKGLKKEKKHKTAVNQEYLVQQSDSSKMKNKDFPK